MAMVRLLNDRVYVKKSRPEFRKYPGSALRTCSKSVNHAL